MNVEGGAHCEVSASGWTLEGASGSSMKIMNLVVRQGTKMGMERQTWSGDIPALECQARSQIEVERRTRVEMCSSQVPVFPPAAS